jgi:3-oxoacyl-[acyl-carrier protein] reductase
MTMALARMLAPDVRVNAVAPGFITGRWLEKGLGPAYEQMKTAVEQRVPLRRVCDPIDVAQAILSLIEGSKLVTGQTLVCDAGMGLGSLQP